PVFRRADRHRVRNRDRGARLCDGRAARIPRRRAVAAGVPWIAPCPDRGRAEAAEDEGGGRRMSANLDFVYRFIPAQAGSSAPTLILLHGTGGDESDLVPFGQALMPGAALLSPRG